MLRHTGSEPQTALAVAAGQRKSVSSRHMRFGTIASLRATATSAFCMPRGLARPTPKPYDGNQPSGLVSNKGAAS